MQGTGSASPAPAGSSSTGPYAKLDGVLYHFYAKTSSIITHNRFTHIVDSRRSSQNSVTSSSQTPQRQTSTRKPGKWFALEVEDSDIFRDEIRLWRSVSAFVPSTLLDASSEETEASTSSQSPVPALVLDVILDTSALSPEQYLVIEEADGSTERALPSSGLRSRRRVYFPSAQEQEQADTSGSVRLAPVSIVLETWRLDFHARRIDDPPDLPALYRSSTAHFKELLGVVKTLPAYRLRQRLQDDRTDPEPLGNRNILKIGARLAVDHSTATEDGLIGLQQDLGELVQRASASEIVPASRSFAPVTTPIGTLATSVEYRANVDFYVEDTRMVQGLQEAALDHDYFSTSDRQQTAQARDSQSPEQQRTTSTSDRKKSLLSTLSQQSRPSPAASTVQAAEADIFGGHVSRGEGSGAGPSVKAVSPVVGRPVAGLSNLRSIPSPAYGALATALPSTSTAAPTTGPTFGTSPILPSPSSTEAAFLTHGRRSSTSERRLRPISGSSGGGGELVQRDNTGSSAANSPLLSRPILSRASASSQARIGSYSPSSPSPLAQQLYAQQSAIAGSSSSRYSSSPSYRAPLGTATMSSISPSLRSVFQTGPASVSQTSQSSLSRTPPKYLTEGKDRVAQSSARLGGRQGSFGESPQVQSITSQPTSISPSSLRQPSVPPQMIKRYSSNFSYRHGRQAASAESEASDGGSSYNAPYSQSWQARLEQRQNIAARSLGRDDRGSQMSNESMRSQAAQRMAPQSITRPTSYGASSKSNDDDLADLVRMFDSRGGLFASDSHVSRSETDSGKNAGSVEASSNDRNEQRQISREAALPTQRSQAAANLFQDRGQALSRSEVDNMLNRMQQSVQGFETSFRSISQRGSPASGEIGTLSSSGARSQTDYPSAPQSSSPLATRSPLSQAAVVSAAGLGGPRNVSTLDFARRHVTPSSGEASQGDSATFAQEREEAQRVRQSDTPFATPLRSAHHRATHTRSRQVETDIDDLDDSVDEQSSRHEERLSRSHPGRDTSRSSIELYGAGGPQTYDPLEDETAGRLELVSDDVANERESYLVGRMGVPRLGSVQSSLRQPQTVSSQRNRPQRAGAPRPYGDHAEYASGVASTGGSSPGADTSLANEGDQRYQRSLVQQFGQSIGASSTRGHAHGGAVGATGAFATTGRALHHTHSIHTQGSTRASMSPWRQRGFHPATSSIGGNGLAHGVERVSSPPANTGPTRQDASAAEASPSGEEE